MRDKIAAHALVVESGAVANIKSLDELLTFVRKASGAREVVGQAMDAVKELFVRVLLPDRPLVPFEDRPFRYFSFWLTSKHKTSSIPTGC
jgi:hypothetical protein